MLRSCFATLFGGVYSLRLPHPACILTDCTGGKAAASCARQNRTSNPTTDQERTKNPAGFFMVESVLCTAAVTWVQEGVEGGDQRGRRQLGVICAVGLLGWWCGGTDGGRRWEKVVEVVAG